MLSSHSFRALAFYERLGYEKQAVIRGQPKGHTNVIYVKHLNLEPRVEEARRQGEEALGRKPICLTVQVASHARGIMDNHDAWPRTGAPRLT